MDRSRKEALQDRIRADGSHERADRDLALLARPELRSVRLQLEFLKPELDLADHGVQHTIVVFGGARLIDTERATARLAAVEGDSEATDADLLGARADLERSRYYEVGRELGGLIGSWGTGPQDNRLTVVTGGGPGGMEAANRGAHEAGAVSAGFNVALPREQQPNPYVTPGLSFEFRYFALRKLHFLLRARALVALPGGYGTLDELFETLCLIQTGKRAPLPVVLVGERFWRRVVDFDYLVEQCMIAPEDLDLFAFAETAQDAWQCIQQWYEQRGRDLLEPSPDPHAPNGAE